MIWIAPFAYISVGVLTAMVVFAIEGMDEWPRDRGLITHSSLGNALVIVLWPLVLAVFAAALLASPERDRA